MQLCAVQKNDNPGLVAHVSGVDWRNIVAVELMYHRSCYRAYTRPNRTRGGVVAVDNTALENMFYIFYIIYISKHIIEEGEVMYSNEFPVLYSKNCEDQDKVLDVRTLTELITQHFAESIGLWNPAYGQAFIFNNNFPKGQIIENLLKKLKIAKENERVTPINQKIKEVAAAIRTEVTSLPLTYNDWPPSESTLLENKTVVPPLLKELMTSLLTSSGWSRRMSKRKERCILSISQDVIYNMTNAKHRTSKHVMLALCMKRKTGSKEMVEMVKSFWAWIILR